MNLLVEKKGEIVLKSELKGSQREVEWRKRSTENSNASKCTLIAKIPLHLHEI